MKIYIYNFLLSGFFICGCTKDKNPIASSAELSIKYDTLSTIAQLYWAGEYEVDGCGYIIEINEHNYKVINENVIDEIYKSFYDPVQVRLEYININKKQSYYCGDLPFAHEALEYDIIEILSIKKL